MNGKKSILIVDDELSIRESLRMILKPAYNVLTAKDGREALHLLEHSEIDLVTLDLRMPNLSGIQTLSELKKLGKNIPVVVITAYGNLQNAQDVIKYGIKDFLTKPFNITDILSSVHNILKVQNDALRVNKIIHEINAILSSKS